LSADTPTAQSKWQTKVKKDFSPEDFPEQLFFVERASLSFDF
jgi:hypothetical protein